LNAFFIFKHIIFRPSSFVKQNFCLTSVFFCFAQFHGERAICPFFCKWPLLVWKTTKKAAAEYKFFCSGLVFSLSHISIPMGLVYTIAKEILAHQLSVPEGTAMFYIAMQLWGQTP